MLQIPHLGVRTFSELLPILERLEEGSLAHQLNQEYKGIYPHLITDITWNSDDELLATSKAGQPRGDFPYLNNLDSVGGCATGQAPDFRDRKNCFHITSVITHN
jgi:hypothetical protein